MDSSVGADLSCSLPIYRPVQVVDCPHECVHVHHCAPQRFPNSCQRFPVLFSVTSNYSSLVVAA